MPEPQIDELLALIRSLKPVAVGDSILTDRGPFAMTSYCTVVPPVSWDRHEVEEILGVTLPRELVSLWDATSGLRLFEDKTFGQWGLIVWSPHETLRKDPEERAHLRPDFFRVGDLIIGEFLGDQEKVLVRCDPESDDFGSVVIVAEIDPRKDWFIPASSVPEFLEHFVSAAGEKFWEPERKECTSCRGGMPVTATTCPHCGEKQDVAG